MWQRAKIDEKNTIKPRRPKKKHQTISHLSNLQLLFSNDCCQERARQQTEKAKQQFERAQELAASFASFFVGVCDLSGACF